MQKLLVLGGFAGVLVFLPHLVSSQPQTAPANAKPASQPFQDLTGSALSVRQYKETRHIVRIDFPSGKETTVTKTSAMYYSPVFSPNRKQIAFTAPGYAPPKTPKHRIPWNLYIMNHDGSKVRKLNTWQGSCYGPSFLDDSHIVFNRTIERPAGRTNHEIWKVGTNGKNLQQLTKGPTDVNHSAGPNNLITFVSKRYGSYEIYVMRGDGTQVRQITGNLPQEQSPRISPDGRRIVFVSKRISKQLNSFEIHSVNLDGSDGRRLTNDSFMDTSPCFAPDSGKIIFRSVRGDFAQLFVMNSDGSNKTQVTSPPANYFYVDWK